MALRGAVASPAWRRAAAHLQQPPRETVPVLPHKFTGARRISARSQELRHKTVRHRDSSPLRGALALRSRPMLALVRYHAVRSGKDGGGARVAAVAAVAAVADVISAHLHCEAAIGKHKG